MAIFNSYVKLQEGSFFWMVNGDNHVIAGDSSLNNGENGSLESGRSSFCGH